MTDDREAVIDEIEDVFRCECENVAMGSYDNQVMLTRPWNMKPVGIDRCISNEIRTLWMRGIVTTGCCCGHKIAPAYIGVEAQYIPAMKDLGYEALPHQADPSREDSFKPKGFRYD